MIIYQAHHTGLGQECPPSHHCCVTPSLHQYKAGGGGVTQPKPVLVMKTLQGQMGVLAPDGELPAPRRPAPWPSPQQADQLGAICSPRPCLCPEGHSTCALVQLALLSPSRIRYGPRVSAQKAAQG